MNLAFCYNVKHTTPSKNITAQKEADFDTPEVIAGIKSALESGGHKVYEVEANEQAYLNFFKLKNDVEIVFNIAEGLRGDTREAQIPAMLDMLDIPYTHASPLTHSISLDKTLTKIVLHSFGIQTPNFQLVKSSDAVLRPDMKFPLIVKPNAEGSSIGIFNENLVFDELKLYERVQWLLHKFREAVLVEEYIDGREFNVAVLGNTPPRVLPVVEQNFSIFPENMPHFASFEAKWLFEDNLPNPHDAYFCPAPVSENLRKTIEDISLKIFSALNVKDVCRIDMRIDKNENIYVLEVNTLPGLNPSSQEISYLPIAARTAGFSFEGLVNTILNEAVKRYGLYPEKKIYHFLKNYWPRQLFQATP